MKRIIFQTLTAALLTVTSAADASTDPDFKRLDTNGDGLIAWAEYAAKKPKSGKIDPRRIFDNVDTNRDGYIDPVEFEAMKQRRKH
ncbi:EF hand [Thiothrix caldifontis]|jgi:hypothetical protein|uniref:EF hand n=1 Tax=Thiothrix caldifontis TaxID=525918 RepID=A0A1H4FY80_9GAMM|nr:EF-hand domain-containing protein [Thiothrix caldifontis]SEB02067.1 EF hand [Thiothrix caldifontis]